MNTPTLPADSELEYIICQEIAGLGALNDLKAYREEYRSARTILDAIAASRAQLRAELEAQLQLNDVPVVEARTVRVILDRVFGERDTKSNQTSSVI